MIILSYAPALGGPKGPHYKELGRWASARAHKVAAVSNLSLG